MVELLDKCIDEPKSITNEELKMLEKTYGICNNNTTCPCGSNKTFSECCKQSWRAANRAIANRDKEVKERKKEENKIEYVIKIGLGVDGPVISPMSDKKKINSFQVEEMLEICLSSMRRTNTDLLIRQRVQEFLNANKKSRFGI